MTFKGRSPIRLLMAGTAAALVVGCGSHSHTIPPQGEQAGAPRVEVPGGASPFSTAIKSVPSGRTESFGSLMICAYKPKARVTLTSVSLPATAHGLRVVDFGTRPNPFLETPPGHSFGVLTGTVASHRITGTTISACLPPREGTQGLLASATELVVAVTRDAPTTGTTRGIVVHYVSSGKTGTASFPEGMTLCAAGDDRTSGC